MSSNQPKNISPGRHVNSRSASSPSARSSTNSIGSYETPPPTSRYAQYIYNSNPRRNNNNNNGGGNRQRRFGDGGPFIHLGEDDNSGLSSETIKKAFRKEIAIYHPDNNASTEAREKFEQLVEAFDILSNA